MHAEFLRRWRNAGRPKGEYGANGPCPGTAATRRGNQKSSLLLGSGAGCGARERAGLFALEHRLALFAERLHALLVIGAFAGNLLAVGFVVKHLIEGSSARFV